MKNIYVLDDNESNSNDRHSGRIRALLMTESEWLKLGNYLEKEQKLIETAEEKRIKDERRKQLSKEMAKTWDNTVINLRRRRLEQRKERARNLENDRKRRFIQARQEENDLKKKVRDEAKAALSLQKDSSKKLTSTLRFSEVLRERAEQIKFESKLKEIEAKRVQDYENSVIADVKKFEEEVKEQKAKEVQRKKQLIVEAQEEFREYFENKRKEQEEKLKLERQDNINILKEIQTEKENAWKEAERKKNLVKEGVRQNRKMIEEYLEQKQLEEEEEDNAIKIHAAAKKKIALIRKKKEQEMRDAAQERRNKISMKLSNEEADRNAKEDAILQKAIEEKETLKEADICNKKAYKERLVNELKKERKAFLEREEQQRLTKKEEAKWNLMQRLKQTEENEKFYKEKLIKKINKMQENKAIWDKQCEERAAAAAEEREQDYNAVKRAVQWWEDEDKEFLAYADGVLEDSKKKGRPLLPILKQVEVYKKENNLIRPPPQHEIWKSHIPIDSVTKQTQTSNIPEKTKNSPTLFKLIDNSNRNVDDQGKRDIVRKPSLGFKQHIKKPVEPWPKCDEVCILPPKNRNGIQNSQK